MAKIFVAGHNGMVGSVIKKNFLKKMKFLQQIKKNWI